MNEIKSGGAFLGAADGPMPLEVMGICAKIGQTLGSNAGLLSDYLTLLAERITASDQAAIVHMGKDAFDRLFTMCKDLLKYGIPLESFSHKAIEMIVNHQLSIEDETTRAEIYSLLLAEEYLAAILPDISQKMLNGMDIHAGNTEINVLRGDMETICGAEILNRLDEVVYSAWMPVPPLLLFKQGYVSAMIDIMANRDDYMNKTSLAFLLENPPKRTAT